MRLGYEAKLRAINNNLRRFVRIWVKRQKDCFAFTYWLLPIDMLEKLRSLFFLVLVLRSRFRADRKQHCQG